jgi:alanine-glyoxylate transaminase/(R)-3-amino-2-methylpropionate-pyruvate transaminase
MLVDGHMQYLFDETGKRYLDGFAGIVSVSVGHCHPRIIEAVNKQNSRLQHTTTIYLHPNIAKFAEKLASTLPNGLDVVYFTNSGSEAYEDKHSGEKYALDVKDVIERGSSGSIAAFIAEPIQGVGGVVEMPPNYLQRSYEYVRRAGGLCIADEVQTGFGRTGENFWGFENHGVVPDIVTMAKGIGNGCPLGAVVTTKEIANSLTEAIHFNTFGGNPVSCAQGLATLEVILDDDMQGNAKRLGEKLMIGLHELQQKYSCIGDVRGSGLMVGIELVEDENKTPATGLTADVFETCKELGLIIGKGGYFGNILRIKPPMCITEEDIVFMLETLGEAFEKETN